MSAAARVNGWRAPAAARPPGNRGGVLRAPVLQPGTRDRGAGGPGLSNREIAEAVSLSVRTVESHIYRASSKAGVSGRSALAEIMRSAGS